jgi:hypothetical protein
MLRSVNYEINKHYNSTYSLLRCTGCFISSVTLLKTPVAPVCKVVESSSCVHSIPLGILHLIGIV